CRHGCKSRSLRCCHGGVVAESLADQRRSPAYEPPRGIRNIFGFTCLVMPARRTHLFTVLVRGSLFDVPCFSRRRKAGGARGDCEVRLSWLQWAWRFPILSTGLLLAAERDDALSALSFGHSASFFCLLPWTPPGHYCEKALLIKKLTEAH